MEILLTIGDYQWENPAVKKFYFYYVPEENLKSYCFRTAVTLLYVNACFTIIMTKLCHSFGFVLSGKYEYCSQRFVFAYKQIRSTHLLLHLLYNHQ